MRYSKYSGRGNSFSLPNEVFLLGLSAGELSVYSFLKRCENRKTMKKIFFLFMFLPALLSCSGKDTRMTRKAIETEIGRASCRERV